MKAINIFSSVQFSSVAQSCPTLPDPMNRSMPSLPVHHQLLEFTETHVHWVSDAIQPSHPLSSPSPPAPNPSQHQSLFQWVSSSQEVAKVLDFQLQHHSLQRNPRLLRLYLDLRARRALIICHILIFYYSKRTVPSCLTWKAFCGANAGGKCNHCYFNEKTFFMFPSPQIDTYSCENTKSL